MSEVEKMKSCGEGSLVASVARDDGSALARGPDGETRAETRTLERALFLVSASRTPCGVEMFARRLGQTWRAIGHEERSVVIGGEIGEIFTIGKALDHADALVMNFPIVAWKRVLLTPLLALIVTRLRGIRTILIVHEWDDLDWRRRLVLMTYALFAKHVMLSSPMVRDQYLESSFARFIGIPTSIIPIPTNIERTGSFVPSAIGAQIRARRQNRIAIGHFGSIYPKKQSDFVLLVAAELKRMGRDVLVVFIGEFVKGLDSVERDFNRQLDLLGLRDDVVVTGYVERSDEIFTLFEELDCFVYRFREGLSSRRSSVLACLQAGKPVLVNAPAGADEFHHHRIFKYAIENNILHLLPADADATAYAAALVAAATREESRPIEMFEAIWVDAARALERAADLESSAAFNR